MNVPPVFVGGGGSGPTSPDPLDFNSQDSNSQRTNTTVPQGSGANSGVILTQNSLDVPLEVQFSINNDRANPSRPSLAVLFRSLNTDDSQTEELTALLYQDLRSALSPQLQTRLTTDELKSSFEDRDPDMIALDVALHFQANLLAIAQMLKEADLKEDETKVSPLANDNFSKQVNQGIVAYSGLVVNVLDNHLTTIGKNNPSYDLFSHVSNQIKETISLST
jgi:hypothetical protein